MVAVRTNVRRHCAGTFLRMGNEEIKQPRYAARSGPFPVFVPKPAPQLFENG
jgi:hypothetical protein